MAKELIASNLGNDLSVERIAQECSLSRSHFSRAFKQATGVAPHTWLLQMRVEKAKELLLAPGMSVHVTADTRSARGELDRIRKAQEARR